MATVYLEIKGLALETIKTVQEKYGGKPVSNQPELLALESQTVNENPDFFKNYQLIGMNAGFGVGIAQTKELISNFSEKVFLEFLPYDQKKAEQIKNKSDVFHFDQELKKFFILKEDLGDLENRKLLAASTRNRPIFASQIIPGSNQFSYGILDLANAFNVTSFPMDLILQSKALGSCFLEHCHLPDDPNLLHSYSTLLRNPVLCKVYLPFAAAWDQAEKMKYEYLGQTGYAEHLQQIFRAAGGSRVVKNCEYKFNDLFKNVESKSDQNGQILVEKYAQLGLSFLQGVALQVTGVYDQDDLFVNTGVFRKAYDELLDHIPYKLSSKSEQVMLALKDGSEQFWRNFKYQSSYEEAVAFGDEIIAHYKERMAEQDLILTSPLELRGNDYFRVPPADDRQYLVLSNKEMYQYNQNHPDQPIFYDEINKCHFIAKYAADNEEIKPFLPRQIMLAEGKVQSDDLSVIRQNMLDFGFSSKVCDDLKPDNAFHYDTENHLSYKVCNPDSSSPLLVMFNFRTSEKKNVILRAIDQEAMKVLREQTKLKTDHDQALELQAKEEMKAQFKDVSAHWTANSENHPYFEAKNLPECRLGFKDQDGTLAEFFNHKLSKKHDFIYFPIMNAGGSIVNLQEISEKGDKKFVSKAPLKGNFIVMGEFDKLVCAKTCLIAEGVATAATVAKYVSDQSCVVACLSCNNMKDVAYNLVRTYPDKTYGLMLDNDVITAATPIVHNFKVEGYMCNPGIKGGLETMASLQQQTPMAYCLPPLKSAMLADKKSDFNDVLSDPELEPALKERIEGFEKQLLEQARLKNLSTHKMLDFLSDSYTKQMDEEKHLKKIRDQALGPKSETIRTGRV